LWVCAKRAGNGRGRAARTKIAAQKSGLHGGEPVAAVRESEKKKRFETAAGKDAVRL